MWSLCRGDDQLPATKLSRTRVTTEEMTTLLQHGPAMAHGHHRGSLKALDVSVNELRPNVVNACGEVSLSGGRHSHDLPDCR